MALVPQPVVLASEATAELLKRVLPNRTLFVRSRTELFGAAMSRGAIVFVDFDLLETIDGGNMDAPIVAIMNVPPADALRATVEALEVFPWLSHIIQAPLLSLERGRSHMELLLERLVSGDDIPPLGAEAVGRTAMIARASRRSERFDRMREFMDKRGLSDRLVTTLLDVGEELVMNALYDAPKEGGYYATAFSRDEDVELPPDYACEISYGVEASTAFVRLRDPFGALTRERLVQVLARCAAGEVVPDASRGGAGLGMWRIFSTASSLAVTVVPGYVTDITVSIGLKDSRRIVRPLAVDLYFLDAAYASLQIASDDHRHLVDNSISFVLVDNTPTPTPSPC